MLPVFHFPALCHFLMDKITDSEKNNGRGDFFDSQTYR